MSDVRGFRDLEGSARPFGAMGREIGIQSSSFLSQLLSDHEPLASHLSLGINLIIWDERGGQGDVFVLSRSHHWRP